MEDWCKPNGPPSLKKEVTYLPLLVSEFRWCQSFGDVLPYMCSYYF